MEFRLERTIEVLRATPCVLRELLGGLSDEWIRADEGPDSFTPYDIVGHLIHGEESDWMTRLAIIVEHGESRPFTPFDRFAMRRGSLDRSLAELLERFEDLRTRNLDALEAMRLQPEQIDLTGTHPELGRVTARQLLATWVVHDLGHIAQVARVMAKAYGDQVGAWREYLPILTRQGVAVQRKSS